MGDKITLTLNELLINPTGKSSAYVANRKVIKENLQERFNVLLKKHKKFEYKVFKKNDDYLFYFKIPSETYDELLYDIFINFTPDNSVDCVKDKTLNRYFIKIFSNSPAFMFTYTYVLNKNDLLIDFLIKKCAEKALEEPPKVKNPVEVYGYEKSLYFACLYIKYKGLNNKFTLSQELFKYNEKKLYKEIMSQENKLIEYNKFKKEAAEKKKKAKKEHTKKQNEAIKKAYSTTRKKRTSSTKK